MKEVTGNLWSYLDLPGYQLCITTNGMVRRDGHGVMGRGCAREALHRFPELGLLLGKAIRANGNVFQPLSSQHPIWSFPVKHDWRDDADLALIAQSTAQLKEIAEGDHGAHFKWVLPRPGCGNGHLLWEDVRPIVEVLPDNVLIISK